MTFNCALDHKTDTLALVWGVICVKYNMHYILTMSSLHGQTIPTCVHTMTISCMSSMPLCMHTRICSIRLSWVICTCNKHVYPVSTHYRPCAVTSICAKCTKMLCGYFHHVLVVGATHTAVDMLEMLCMLNFTCIDHLSYH